MWLQISSRKYRSCVVTRNAPRYFFKNSAIHSIESVSRWFVGSSRISKSGLETIARQSATRRFSPPDKVPINRSGSGALRCVIAVLIRVSMFHASAAAICCSSSDCRLESAASVSYSESNCMACAAPSRIVSITVASAAPSMSCGRYPVTRPVRRVISPASGWVNPASIFRNVDLPHPLRPTIPRWSPSRIVRDADLSTSLSLNRT